MNSLATVSARQSRGETEKESARHESIAQRLCGEQRMWLAVLNQAITDATFSDTSLAGYTTRNRQRLLKARRTARAFLCKHSDDLEYICDGAGVNADKILEQARELRNRGWQ
jgi:hypothetical protein